MIPTIRSEFRKLFTIRSTYIVSILAMLIAGFFSFYVEGLRGADNMMQPAKLQNEILSSVSVLAIFGSIIATLLITHEYRYNTIMYTLTSSNSRTKVLWAKFVAVTGYVSLFTAVGLAFAVGCMYLGLAIKDITIIPQHVAWGDLIWRTLFYAWAYGIAGLVLGLLMRQVVGAIVAIFLFPSTIEPLLGLLLKENAKYLPFTSLNNVVGTGNGAITPNALSFGKSAAVFGVYLFVGWIVAWILLEKRDAN